MRVSIVIATYNAAQYLEACLDSCLAQTWPDKEIIVMDGGSHDGTVDILRRYENRLAYWHSEKDNGIYDAWNKALKHATGEWVLFRGADDTFWEDTSLANAVPYLASAKQNEVIVYGSIVTVDDEGHVRGVWGVPWEEARRRFFQEMMIPHPAAFQRADLFARFGGFDPSFRFAGDYEFLLRVLRNDDLEARLIPHLILTRMLEPARFDSRLLRYPYEAVLARRKVNIPGISWILLWRITSNMAFILARKVLGVVLGRERTESFYRRRHIRHSQSLSSNDPRLMGNDRSKHTISAEAGLE